MAKYSQGILRLRQREHVGFSLEHLTLDRAQPEQHSRSLDLLAGALSRGLATPEGVDEEVVVVIVGDLSNYSIAGDRK